MEDFEGNKVFARYSSFSIDSESSGYTLHISGFTDRGAGDALSYHNITYRHTDRSSPPLTKTRTPLELTVPDYTWGRSGMAVVTMQIQTVFIVGGLTALFLVLECSGTVGKVVTTP
uniref:Fibrinogen C-terminal domain-containing protein n=1 Tax=Sander lucioperca TaxID=283035 RepID=A0A8C9Y214_SANLU